MTHVHAVRARNIKNVAEKMHKVLYRLEKKVYYLFLKGTSIVPKICMAHVCVYYIHMCNSIITIR